MSSLDLSEKSVLVVDDVKFSRTTLASLLSGMGKPEVSLATNGHEALERLYSQGGIDLVISDFNMPLMHGLQLLRAVRMGSKGIRRDMPFAMVTGYSEKYLVDSALALDVNAFLIKPVSKQGLERRLKRMLEQIDVDDWLKPADSYKSIEVDNALELQSEPSEDEDKETLARGVALQTDLLSPKKTQGQRFTEDEIKKSPPLSNGEIEVAGISEEGSGVRQVAPPIDLSNAVQCPIKEVPDNVTLAQDIYTSDGRLYLNAGETLTPRVLSILIDLYELGHPVETIWIVQ